MDETTITILKRIIAQVNAIELTILDSELSEKYKTNLTNWKKEIDSRIGEAYLKSLSDEENGGSTLSE